MTRAGPLSDAQYQERLRQMQKRRRRQREEDLRNLMQKANTNSVHLARNRSDQVAKRTMQLTLDKIRALAHYYKDRGILPEDWEFRPETF